MSIEDIGGMLLSKVHDLKKVSRQPPQNTQSSRGLGGLSRSWTEPTLSWIGSTFTEAESNSYEILKADLYTTVFTGRTPWGRQVGLTSLDYVLGPNDSLDFLPGPSRFTLRLQQRQNLLEFVVAKVAAQELKYTQESGAPHVMDTKEKVQTAFEEYTESGDKTGSEAKTQLLKTLDRIITTNEDEGKVLPEGFKKALEIIVEVVKEEKTTPSNVKIEIAAKPDGQVCRNGDQKTKPQYDIQVSSFCQIPSIVV